MDRIIYIESGTTITPYVTEVKEIYKNTPNMFFSNSDIIKYYEHETSGDKFIALRLSEQTVPELSVSASTKLIGVVNNFNWDVWSQKIYND